MPCSIFFFSQCFSFTGMVSLKIDFFFLAFVVFERAVMLVVFTCKGKWLVNLSVLTVVHTPQKNMSLNSFRFVSGLVWWLCLLSFIRHFLLQFGFVPRIGFARLYLCVFYRKANYCNTLYGLIMWLLSQVYAPLAFIFPLFYIFSFAWNK